MGKKRASEEKFLRLIIDELIIYSAFLVLGPHADPYKLHEHKHKFFDKFPRGDCSEDNRLDRLAFVAFMAVKENKLYVDYTNSAVPPTPKSA